VYSVRLVRSGSGTQPDNGAPGVWTFISTYPTGLTVIWSAGIVIPSAERSGEAVIRTRRRSVSGATRVSWAPSISCLARAISTDSARSPGSEASRVILTIVEAVVRK